MNDMASGSSQAYIFLSHSGVDTQAASQFAQLLRSNGLRVWFDKDDLQPGELWMSRIEDALQHASAMVVYLGRLGVQNWVDREVRVGLVRNTFDPVAFRLIPVLGEGSGLESLPPFLQQHQCVDLRDKERIPSEIARLVTILKQAAGERSIAADYWALHSPFRDLQVFQSDDAWLFFGRDLETTQLIERLGQSPILAVVGKSGSGKSSLIRAGLLPALRRGRLRTDGSPVLDWQIAVFRPSEMPFAEIAESVPRQLASDLEPARLQEMIGKWRQSLPQGGSALRDAIVAISGQSPDSSRILLVVDQFEEIFTLTHDAENREKYIEALFAAARIDSSIPIHLVIVMRADFYANCLDHPLLSRLFQTNLYNVPLISSAQMRENIEKRLALAGAKLEPSLIDALLSDVGTEPGNLALLEHALGELWRRQGRSAGILTNSDYAQIGGLRGALARHADTVYQTLTESDRILAAKIFLALVQVGEDIPDTRRRVPKSNLLAWDNSDRVEALLDRLASSRLISIGGDTLRDPFVEVSHEALIREWPRLRDWISENRQDLLFERRLLQAAEEWDALSRDSSALLHGVRLVTAENWLAKHERASGLVRQFIDASIQARYEAAQRDLANRERERQIKEARQRWFRRITAGVAAVVVLASILASWLLRHQRNAAEARELYAWAATSIEDNPERALILGFYTWGKQHAMVSGLEDLLHEALVQSPSRISLTGHLGEVWSVAWSPDGTKLATASQDKTVKVWEVRTGRELQTFHGHQAAVLCVAWSPDGTKLATGSEDKTAKIWEMGRDSELQTLQGHQAEVFGISWSPDGTKLATASVDKTAKVWDVRANRELLTLSGHQDPVVSIAWSRDGTKLATASYDNTAKIWAASTGQSLGTLMGHQGAVLGIAWSPDGTKLVTASQDKTAKVWEAKSRRELQTLHGHQGEVVSVGWSPTDSRLATTSSDKTVKIWSAESGQELQTMRGHQGAVWSVVWSPDGRKLATASLDTTAKIWEPGTGSELPTLYGHQNDVRSVAWSPDGSRLATASGDETGKTWNADTGEELQTMRGHHGALWSIAWSPDGAKLVTASFDKTAKIWDAQTGQELQTILGHQAAILSVAWSPDGTRLVTGSRDKTAKIWDAQTGQELQTILGHQDAILSVAWSPDGSKVATGSYDKTIRIWDAKTGHTLQTLYGHQQWVLSVAWSPDGKQLATASEDKTVKVWDARDWRLLQTLSGHQGFVFSVSWSPDGSKLATGSDDQTVKVWEAGSGRELLTLRARRGLWSVAWSPDGKKLAAAGADKIVQIYAIDHIELLQLVRSRITRSLTPAECRRFLDRNPCPELPEIP